MMKTEKIGLYVKRLVASVFCILVMFGCATPQVEQLETASSEPEPTRQVAKVFNVSTEELVGKTRITIAGDSELTYTAFKLTDPLRLVLELPSIDTSEVSELTFDSTSPIMRITPSQFTDGDIINSRIEVALSRLVPYQVFSDANKLFIDLETPVDEMAMVPAKTSSLPPGFEELAPIEGKTPFVIESRPGANTPEVSTPSVTQTETQTSLPAGQTVPQPGVPSIQPAPQPELPTIHIEQPPKTVGGVTSLPGMLLKASVIKDLQVSEVDGKTRIAIYADNIPEFDVKRSKTPPRLTIDLKQSDLPPGQEKVLSPDDLETIIKQVRVFQLRKTPDGTDNIVRVLVDLLRPTKHEVITEPGMLMLNLEHQAVFAKAELPDNGIVEVPLTTGIEDVLDGETAVSADSEVAAGPTIRTPKTDEEKEYQGQLISIHFQEANILDVLQVIAEVSELNLVVHPGVTGTVTVHLNNIPWDQALDIILKMNNLSVEIEGNILRVAQSNIFQQEIAQRVEQQRQQIEARRVQEELEPLETKLITINFAEPGGIVDIVQQYFEGTAEDDEAERRGTITVDERTKTLIIQDTGENIKKIEEIVATLDRRTPQVMIEARVVSLSSFFRKELGISWGGSFYANPQHGNALDYRFPYSIDIPSFGVTFPTEVSNPVFTTGNIQIGSIDDVISIFAKIDAAEQENLAKTLGQPKIFTQDNVAASVSAGQTRTITETTTNQGVTTTTSRDIEANLELNVTPRVSSDGYITMTVTVQNDAFTATTGTDVSTQEVNSEITVKDGETVVIGGVFQTTDIKNFSGVPFLHKIPVIGHLFKSTLPNQQQKSELLVFLTPRILDKQILQPEQEGANVSLSY